MSSDQSLTCRDCNNQFIWSAGEQDFFATMGFSPPTRCKDCRGSRRQQQPRPTSPAKPERELFDAYCKFGDHTVQVPFQIDPKRPWDCKDHREASKEAREKTLFSVYCTAGNHTVRVPFQIDGTRPWDCRDHRGQGHESSGPAPRKEIYCEKGGHMESVPLSFMVDESRSWSCKTHRGSDLGLSMRSDRHGDFTGSTQRAPGLPNLAFNHDRQGNFRGSSQRVPGLNLTFHTDRSGKVTGSSQHIPGIGTFTSGRDGKMKSFTDNRGFRTGRNGGFKGSSRRF